MEDDDFTFFQVGLPADKEYLEAQLAVLKIDDIRIKDDFSYGAGDSQIDTLLWKDKLLDDTSLQKQGTNGSFSSNVIDIKDDFFDGAGDSQIGTILWKDKSLDDTSLDKQGTVGSLSFNVIDMSTPKTDLPKETASARSKDSGKGSLEQMIPTKKLIVRAKVPFEKGYSQMDWLKLTRTHPDLAGLKGESNKRLISMDEVKQHKTEGSIWTVLKGRVYNIAPYMKFHPGGVDMLMKGAGKDCTSLFNKYHAWVNAEFLLEKCLVGTLDESR